MIRVGFVLDLDYNGWVGGLNYYRNLFKAIELMDDRKIKPIIFTGKKVNLGTFNEFPEVEIIQSSLFDSFKMVRFAFRRALASDLLLERLLKKHNIDLLSHYGYLGAKAKIPTIGWIPDFQHRHFPEFFSQEEIEERNRHFGRMCSLCSYIILSSFDAKNDLESFYRSCSKSGVLHFVDSSTSTINATKLEVLKKNYNFSGDYFYIPNQFWKHKNHSVVVEALKILRSRKQNVLVLATGPTSDHRNKDYFNSFEESLKQSNLQDYFRILGFVPYSDIIGFMENTISLINPSLFEGWSTTVEEAKSLGKRIILSDIPVHREQAPKGGVFFNPKNPEELAEAMWMLRSKRDERTDQELMKEAQKALPERRNAFAQEYEKIVLNVLCTKH